MIRITNRGDSNTPEVGNYDVEVDNGANVTAYPKLVENWPRAMAVKDLLAEVLDELGGYGDEVDLDGMDGMDEYTQWIEEMDDEDGGFGK